MRSKQSFVTMAVNWTTLLLLLLLIAVPAWTAGLRRSSSKLLKGIAPADDSNCKGHGESCGDSHGCCESLKCMYADFQKDGDGHCECESGSWNEKRSSCYNEPPVAEEDSNVFMVALISGIAGCIAVSVVVLLIIGSSMTRKLRTQEGVHAPYIPPSASAIIAVPSVPCEKPDLPPLYSELKHKEMTNSDLPPAYAEAMHATKTNFQSTEKDAKY